MFILVLNGYWKGESILALNRIHELSRGLFIANASPVNIYYCLEEVFKCLKTTENLKPHMLDALL